MSRPDHSPRRNRAGHVPVFVATTGGHLVELQLLAAVLEPERHGDGVWITHRTPQSESMLVGKRVHYVPYIHPRRLGEVLRGTPRLLRLLRLERADIVYSTGASVSLSALPLALLSGARPVFIESLARVDGPSMAGRIHQRLPWVRCYTQYPDNVGARWEYAFSLLDSFARTEPVVVPLRRVFVTLGTIRPYGFRRLLETVHRILPPGTDVVWQTGITDLSGLDLPGSTVSLMSDDAFRAEVDRADVVIAHAGVGTFIRCLEAGRVPVLVARRAAHGEHVDDHQTQIADAAAARGLAVVREADAVSYDDLVIAAALRVRPVTDTRGSLTN